uniref:Uncharacterized protein n=1 Tax=Picea sitchensis TaxID=3332 RepID=D5AAY5_PICSI|nr:unknown [Picea sitchensis]
MILASISVLFTSYKQRKHHFHCPKLHRLRNTNLFRLSHFMNVQYRQRNCSQNCKWRNQKTY